MKIQYVCGFLFNPEMTEVVLIEKNRPDWQKGKFNGIGGKIEPGEQDYAAMRREFIEETGVDIEDWKYFARLENAGWETYFYFAVSILYSEVKTMTDEVVHILRVEEINKYNVIENLRWLIPMCKDSKHLHTVSQAA